MVRHTTNGNDVTVLRSRTGDTVIADTACCLCSFPITNRTLTFKLNKTICSLFFLLGVTCILLSFGVHNTTVDIVGGYFGILTSANAFWLAYAELVNDVIGEGKEIIPLGQWQWNKHKDAGGAHVPGRIHGHRVSTIMGPNRSAETTEPDVERGENATVDDGSD